MVINNIQVIVQESLLLLIRESLESTPPDPGNKQESLRTPAVHIVKTIERISLHYPPP